MKQTNRLFISAAVLARPLLAHAHDHMALVKHLKHDIGGYAMVLMLMVWAVVELRKGSAQSNQSMIKSETPEPLYKLAIVNSACKAFCRR